MAASENRLITNIVGPLPNIKKNFRKLYIYIYGGEPGGEPVKKCSECCVYAQRRSRRITKINDMNKKWKLRLDRFQIDIHCLHLFLIVF